MPMMDGVDDHVMVHGKVPGAESDAWNEIDGEYETDDGIESDDQDELHDRDHKASDFPSDVPLPRLPAHHGGDGPWTMIERKRWTEP